MKEPQWRKTIERAQAFAPSDVVTPCFRSPRPSTGFVISLDLPWDSVYFQIMTASGVTRNCATKLFSESLKIAIDYDLMFSVQYESIILSRSLYWKNFGDGRFVDADFLAQIGFDDVQYNDLPASPYFEVTGEVALVGSEREHLGWDTGLLTRATSIRAVRQLAKQFNDTLHTCLEKVSAPFKPSDELPLIPRTPLDMIFYVNYRDSNGEDIADRLCHVRRSIYSMPANSPLKWISAYSERDRKFKDLKLTQFGEFASFVDLQPINGHRARIPISALKTSQELHFPWKL